MAQVELPKGIAAIHGRLGDFIYRSRKQADGTYKVYAHYSPKKAKVSAKRVIDSFLPDRIRRNRHTILENEIRKSIFFDDCGTIGCGNPYGNKNRTGEYPGMRLEQPS